MNKEKKFFEENSEGQIFYSEGYSGVLQNLAVKVIENESMDTYCDYSTSLFGSNIPWKKEKLGKQDFCTSDSSNRRLYGWKINLDHGVLWILSGGNGRGTSYEWYSEKDQYDELFEDSVTFLFDLYNLGHLLKYR